MAWSSPDSFLTRLFSGDPVIIIIAFLVSVSLPLFVHLYFYTTSDKSTEIPTFLLLGPSGSGKTSLISLLQRRSKNPDASETSPTRTSQVPYDIDLILPASVALGSNKYRSKNDFAIQDASKSGVKYKMIDTPGHGKLRLDRALSNLENPALRGIIFVVDSTALDTNDSTVYRDTATYLHDMLFAVQQAKLGKKSNKSKFNVPILIAANKQDLFTALPTGAIKDRLQTEIERVRVARRKGISTVGKESDADEEEDILGGGGEDKFNFKLMDDEYGIAIDVLGGAVRGEEAGKGVRRWEEWIGNCL